MNWKKLVITTGVLLLVNLFSFVMAKVSVRIVEDTYVLPVAELASTKTYPEVIVIENDLVAVSLIPNRGRILSSYALKSGQETMPFLYQSFVPVPMVLPGGLHVVEFGGYYLSLPWNDRDRQPFDFTFEIIEKSQERVEVLLSGKDILRKTLTECWVRLRDKSPLVEIEVRVVNTSKRDRKTFVFKDFMVVNVDVGCKVLLPVNAVKILESRGEWAGKPGEVLSWPTSLGEWGNMEGYFRMKTENLLDLPVVGLWYPRKNMFFIKTWEPEDFFQSSEVWSWGTSYREETGADAYVVVSSVNEHLALEPQGEIAFKSYILGFEEPSWDGNIEQLFERIRTFLPAKKQ